MPTTLITAGDATNSFVITAGNDGAITIQSGPNGGKVNALSISSAGNITLPATAAPAFSAYANNTQSISNGTFTKLQINTELFDTNNNFDSTTNYRFTPTVAGYYQVSGAWYCSTASGQVISFVYKNGVGYQSASLQAYSSGDVTTVSSLVFLNGTTDYIEFYVYQGSGSAFTTLANRPDLNYFQAVMVRSA